MSSETLSQMFFGVSIGAVLGACFVYFKNK